MSHIPVTSNGPPPPAAPPVSSPPQRDALVAFFNLLHQWKQAQPPPVRYSQAWVWALGSKEHAAAHLGISVHELAEGK
jgi:hypothetical protein